MSSDAQGVAGSGATPGEAAAGLHAAAGSTQAPTAAATRNDESAASVGTKSRVERVMRVQPELRRGKPRGENHPV